MARSSSLPPDAAATWRNLLAAHDAMLDRVDDELVADAGLTLGEFEVLAHLADAPEHQMRMNELATRTRLSPSGLTRRFDALVRRGWVVRRRSDDDGRGILAGITSKGLDTVVRARPVHDAAVRRWCFDRLDAPAVQALGDIAARLAQFD